MSVDWRRKPDYLREPTETWAGLHTERLRPDDGFKPVTGGAADIN